MDIKLLACDLDETLMSGSPIVPEVRDFLYELQQGGIKFVINSGRCLDDILTVLSESKFLCPEGYPDAIVSDHGVFVHYLEGRNYVADSEWNELKRGELEMCRQEIGWKSKSWEMLIEDKMGIAPQRKYIEQGVFRVGFNSDSEAENVRLALHEDADFRYTAFLRNRNFLMACLSTALKGLALQRVAAFFKVEPGNVVAIGDSHNDYDMLDGKFGFIPAAPSNAEVPVKELVLCGNGYVASRACGGGVVEIVHHLRARAEKS